ncbi:MAG: YjdF family protein [Butyricicoccus sp.]|nr:YjdF family protein [Butyricicoccus sp.]
MDTASTTLTVFFEDPFWVGVFERVSDGKLSVCKVTFGAEPKYYEVWDFILKQYSSLQFSPSVQAEVRQRADNPKRRQRDAKKQVQGSGIGTKSQQTLAMQREGMKIIRKQASKEQKEGEKRRQFDLKQQKRKEKHRGH